MVKFKDFLQQQSDAVLIKTSFQTDLTRLRAFFKDEVKPLTKEYQGGKTWHGGWSVQSNTGDIDDGWQPGGSLIKKNELGEYCVDEEGRANMFPMGQAFRTPTPLYKGIAEELVMGLDSTGFDAKRTRFAELEIGGIDRWHRDSTVRPMWRGHIAVETNPNCFFWWRSDDGQQTIKRYIPADGHLYMVRVDALHRITNHGECDRVHVLTDSSTSLSQCVLWVEPLAFLQSPSS
jgi:hypothetical protein